MHTLDVQTRTLIGLAVGEEAGGTGAIDRGAARNKEHLSQGASAPAQTDRAKSPLRLFPGCPHARGATAREINRLRRWYRRYSLHRTNANSITGPQSFRR